MKRVVDVPSKKSLARQPPGKAIPPGLKNVIAALAIDGSAPKAEIARDFGVNEKTVARIAETVRGIDPARIQEIKQALPALMTLLAGAHAVKALEHAGSDPALSVKSTFGAKLAVEAGRLAQPQAEAPGATLLTFIQALQVNVGPPVPPPRRDDTVDAPVAAPVDLESEVIECPLSPNGNDAFSPPSWAAPFEASPPAPSSL